jgi:hypothetical protein
MVVVPSAASAAGAITSSTKYAQVEAIPVNEMEFAGTGAVYCYDQTMSGLISEHSTIQFLRMADPEDCTVAHLETHECELITYAAPFQDHQANRAEIGGAGCPGIEYWEYGHHVRWLPGQELYVSYTSGGGDVGIAVTGSALEYEYDGELKTNGRFNGSWRLHSPTSTLSYVITPPEAVGLFVGEAASFPRVEAEKYPLTLVGDQTAVKIDFSTIEELEIATDIGTYTCESATFAGEAWAPDDMMDMVPQLDDCSLAGVIPTEIDGNGCAMRYHVGSGTGPYQGSVDIICPTGKEITMSSPALGSSCRTEIPPQNGLEGATFTNTGSGSGREITVALNLTGLRYTISDCPEKNGEASDGTVVDGQSISGLIP